VPLQHLQDLGRRKRPPFHASQQPGDLISGRHQGAKKAPVGQGGQHLIQIVPGLAHVEEQGVRVGLAKPLGDVALRELHIVEQASHGEVLARDVNHVLASLVRVDPAVGAHAVRQGHRQGAASRAGLDDAPAVAHVQPQEDLADLLGVDDLRGPLEVHQ